MQQTAIEMRLEFAKAVEPATGEPISYAAWRQRRGQVRWEVLKQVGREIPALVRVSVQVVPKSIQSRSILCCRLQTRVVYVIVSQNDWGKRRFIERWQAQLGLPLGVPIPSGVHREWWDFEEDWNYWYERGYFLQEVVMRARLLTPRPGSWKELCIPVRISLG